MASRKPFLVIQGTDEQPASVHSAFKPSVVVEHIRAVHGEIAIPAYETVDAKELDGDVDPADPRAAALRGLHLLPEHPASAVNHLRHAEDLAPGNPAALDTLGLAFGILGQQETAKLHHLKALLLHPSSITTLNNCGAQFLVLNDPAESLFYSEQALAIQPSHFTALHHKSLALKAIAKK